MICSGYESYDYVEEEDEGQDGGFDTEWGKEFGIEESDDGWCGENVQDWENGVDEADFFMRDERENKRDEKCGYGQVVLYNRLSREDPLIGDRLVKPQNSKWEIGRQEKGITLGEVVVPVVAAVEDR